MKTIAIDFDGVINSFVTPFEENNPYFLPDEPIYESKEFIDRLSEKMYDTRHEGTESHKMGILTIYHNNYEYPGIYWSPQEDGHHTEFVDGKYTLVKTIYPEKSEEEKSCPSCRINPAGSV